MDVSDFKGTMTRGSIPIRCSNGCGVAHDRLLCGHTSHDNDVVCMIVRSHSTASVSCTNIAIIICSTVDVVECSTQRSRSLYCTQEISMDVKLIV